MDHDLEQKISDRAHRLWQAGGYQHGRSEEDWLEAERQIMAEEGLGEPGGRGSADSGGEQADLAPGDRPEPQPEIPADPLRNPELISPRTDPEYPATPGLQEMPADPPRPEIPAEPGIADMPMPPPGAVGTVRAGGNAGGGKKAAAAATAPTAAAEAKGRGGRPGGKNKGSGASV